MAPSFLVYLFTVWCSASALVYGNKRDYVTTGVAERAGVEADPSVASVSADPSVPQYYLLQRVGFEDSGPAKQPRSPHVAGAECLTVGGLDRKQGTALGWMPCQDLTTVESAAQMDAQTRELQLFVLNADGSISDKQGRCIRRVPCEEGRVLQGYIYDLYSCDEMDGKYTVRIKAEKAQANSIDHLRDMGWLRNAVEMDTCQLCGPYQLENHCMASLCGASYQAKPGWTKLASQYVGDEAVMGLSTVGVVGDSELGSDHTKEQLMGIDMSGLGYTKQTEGMCGSWVTDSPTIDSYFYLLKDDTQTVTPAPETRNQQVRYQSRTKE